MKKIYLFNLFIISSIIAFSQSPVLKTVDRSGFKKTNNLKQHKINSHIFHLKSVLLDENFESVVNIGTTGDLPTGWSKSTQSTGTSTTAGGNTAGSTGYNGFYTGNIADANINSYWPVPTNGSNLFAQCNDDFAGDICCEERLISPALDFTGQDSVVLIFDAFHDQNYGSGDAIVEVSTDSGANWTQILTLTPDASAWQSVFINLDNYSDSSNVQISFFWNDGGDCTVGGDNWGTGLAIDNVKVAKILGYNITNKQIYPTDIFNDYEYTIIPKSQVRPLDITMIASNTGANTQQVGFDYLLKNGGAVVNSGMSSNVSLNSLESDTLVYSTNYLPSNIGNYNLEVTSNSTPDNDTSDNFKSKTFKISDSTWSKDYFETNGIDASFGQITSNTGLISLGHLFIASNDGIVNSIDFGVGPQAYNNDGVTFFVGLYEYDVVNEVFEQMTAEEYVTGPNDAGQIINVPLLGTGPVAITTGNEYLVVAGHLGDFTASDGTSTPRIACSGPGIEGEVLGFYEITTLYSLSTPPSPIVRINVVEDNTSVDENYLKNNISIFPNPSNGEFNITASSNELSNLTVKDITGKIVISKVFSSNTIINLNNYAKGVYVLDIKNKKGIFTQKIFLQ